MTLAERILAASRRARRQVIYRMVRRRIGEAGITNDAHGRGVIFFPGDIKHVGHLTGNDMWEALADRAEDRLEAAKIPTTLYHIIVDDHIDYFEHCTN